MLLTHWHHNKYNSEFIKLFELSANGSTETVRNCFQLQDGFPACASTGSAASFLPRGRPRSHWQVRH